jgi:starch-binding outer membrane protein, SusD/RagB family
MKKRTSILGAAVAGMLLLTGCEDHLDYNPFGTIAADELATPERVEGLVISAYSGLGNDHWSVPFGNNWMYGSVRSDDAYKGGGGTGDQGGFHRIELFQFASPNMGEADGMWFRIYVGISRANQALARLNDLPADQFAQRTVRQAEMRFVRGHFHFLLKKHFKRIPFIDETMGPAEIRQASNVALSDAELWGRISADIRFAVENLPADAPQQVGRISRSAAQAYLAKVLLFQAYEQDAQHRVTGIDAAKLNEVVQLTDAVIGSGRYALFPDFAQNFLAEFDNGPESVFAIQRSINDGTPEGRTDMAVGLNYPMGPQYGCCWFHIPSQNLANAFRTTANGTPDFQGFNQVNLRARQDIQAHTVDPRLNHTVSMPGVLFKYDAGIVYDPGSWARDQSTYGPFSTMKELQHPESPVLRRVGPFFGSAKNSVVIRYADVLLWKAEALIELGRHNEALPLINQIRERARNSTGRLHMADGAPAGNYHVEPYRPGVNIDWTQENARQALRWERRLEFAMEGHRFFDLVRWGIAAETLNGYFEVERTRRDYLRDGLFRAGRDEYLPIPQQQIDFSEGLYQQNPGYN